MRLSQFTKQPISFVPNMSLYRWNIRIQGQSESRLAPFHPNDVIITFPGLNVTVGNITNVQLRGNDRYGQIVSCKVDVAMFAEDEDTANDLISKIVFVYVEGDGGQLFLADPDITILS
ncbi:hypothetical protein [Terasakiella sp.]|uniref:hypothetical protein n=1 Tax=Terasakiella sp. TaxID=2034861 RepID=UPI003AA7E025